MSDLPDRGDPRRKGERGHLVRAFVCAVILHASCDPADGILYEENHDAIARLTESALFLGDDTARMALSLLAWCTTSMQPEDPDQGFLMFGMLLLACELGDDAFDSPVIGRLYDWGVVQLRARREYPWENREDRTLLREHLKEGRMSNRQWKSMTRRILIEAPIKLPENYRGRLLRLGTRIIKG